MPGQCGRRHFAPLALRYGIDLPELRTALAHYYGVLLGCLHGPAKAQLQEDQARWEVYHKLENQSAGNVVNTYYSRIRWLRGLLRELPMGPYPLMGVRVVILTKLFKCGAVDIDAHYPHFDNPGAAGAAATNRFFADSANKAARRMETAAAEVFNYPGPVGQVCPVGYDYEQSFDLARPGPYLLDVYMNISRYTGGAHPLQSFANYLIDLHTDAIVPLSEVFAPHSHWRSRLREIASADFKKRWPSDFWYVLGFESWVTPTYSFAAHGMEATYGAGSLGSIGVRIPYSQVQGLIRVGGPLALALHERADGER
jgi:hypothetical protein